MPRPKLSLKREALAELADAGLAEVVGGEKVTFTCFSCLTFVSCNPIQCLPTVRYCIETG